MSSHTNPFKTSATGALHELSLIPLDVGQCGVQSERWLHEALFRHYEALPAEEINPHIGPLMPVYVEIETGAGAADILYLTPSGWVWKL